MQGFISGEADSLKFAMPVREQKSHESGIYQGLGRERGIVVAYGEAEQIDALVCHLF